MNMACHCCETNEPGAVCPWCITPIPEQLVATIEGITLGADTINSVDPIELNGAFVLPREFTVNTCERRYLFTTANSVNPQWYWEYDVTLDFGFFFSVDSVIVSVLIGLALFTMDEVVIDKNIGIFKLAVPAIDGKIPCAQLFPRTFDFDSQLNFQLDYIDTSSATVSVAAIP